MRLWISLGVGLALVAGGACAGGFNPHPPSSGFQRPPAAPAGPAWPAMPAQPPAYHPPAAPRAPAIAQPPPFKPYKPYEGDSIYPDRGGTDPYPQTPKRRRSGSVTGF